MTKNKTPWDFRPSALHHNYENATTSLLMNHYLRDASRAAKNGGLEVPHKPQSTFGAIFLRTCQWNIHYLDANWLGYRKPEMHVSEVADAILEVDADVIILNEFGLNGRRSRKGGVDALSARLESAGHVIHEAPCFCPTAIATRLPVVSFGKCRLDSDRAAVNVTVDASIKDESISNCINTQVAVYGTHLECSDDFRGSYRLDEATNLLSRIKSNTSDPNESVLIAGDFNQQRSCDYTASEWKAICDNKAQRSSPADDGVAKALRDAGFTCCYDQKNVDTNWKGVHPPSTHWSGTTIDYSYSKGSNISLVGVYVLPYNLSDHRMVVCDWKITPEQGKANNKAKN